MKNALDLYRTCFLLMIFTIIVYIGTMMWGFSLVMGCKMLRWQQKNSCTSDELGSAGGAKITKFDNTTKKVWNFISRRWNMTLSHYHTTIVYYRYRVIKTKVFPVFLLYSTQQFHCNTTKAKVTGKIKAELINTQSATVELLSRLHKIVNWECPHDQDCYENFSWTSWAA